jgi:3',5'-cyclic-AMP phosphodiesterase
MRTAHVLTWTCLAVAAPACARDTEFRALADLDVGTAEKGGLAVDVSEGLAHVRRIEAGRDGQPGRLELWALAPAFELTLAATPAAGREWLVIVGNCMPDAIARALDGDVEILALEDPRPTGQSWRVTLPPPGNAARARVQIAPPNAEGQDPDQAWRFAVVSDVQLALPRFDEILEHIGRDPAVRFIISSGDLLNWGRIHEYELLEEQLAASAVPLFSTIGNHEVIEDPMRWHERFGRFNVHFTYRDVVFSLVDSAGASLDPAIHERLDAWLEDGADRVHVFGTHYPLFDPAGARASSFRSLREGQMLLERLAAGGVDVTFYGHVHSFYEYSNAGIPAYISGGGGGLPERWDGIGRHFLSVEVTAREIRGVSVVDVD